MKKGNYYLGLDIGSNSVGYAVTDEEYNLLKFHGDSAWGVHVFEEASLSAERRTFRSARRRLARRKQRVLLLQELFANAIEEVDPKFYQRLQASTLYRDEAGDRFPIFNDEKYTDQDYYKQYPTIHHLIVELMNDSNPHDVRLVYLACSWLVAHRGHFLSNIDKNNLSSIQNFSLTYEAFKEFFIRNGYLYPWGDADSNKIGEILKKKITISEKEKELTEILTNGEKIPKEMTEDFPFDQKSIIKLLSGGTVELKKLFGNDSYSEYGKISLNFDDDKLGEIATNIGDDFAFIEVIRKIYDWAILADSIGDSATISEAKVKVYEQHKQDLALLKRVIKKYAPEKYDEIFRDLNLSISNYVAYVRHSDISKMELNSSKKFAQYRKDIKGSKKASLNNLENFSKYILEIIKPIIPDEEDEEIFQEMKKRLSLRTFLPKQKVSDNRVIPQQLYWYELNEILQNAEKYLPFLAERDEKDLSISDKIRSIFSFKIPYFVGPLNENSEHAWIVRKSGKIYPWNFEDIVDLEGSEKAFIRRMTNTCTYIPGEPVLPKDSLIYHKFTVLNEINNLRINGNRISVELKQKIYKDLFLNKKKVTRKSLINYLISQGEIEKGTEQLVSGIDEEIKSNLAPQISFKNLIESGKLNETDVEKIIERSTFSEDKQRLKHWINKEYPNLSEEDVKYICSLKIKNFGRLSRKFLNGVEGVDKTTGEVFTIISALWNTQKNLMELLSADFDFMEKIESLHKSFYEQNSYKLDERLDEMYLSASVKRAVYRTLDVIKDITKAFGSPKKIFVEMTRGTKENQKGKRTKTRKQQILELYQKCDSEDVRLLKKQLEEMGEFADNKLQSEKLFLYYLQLGKCMYSGKTISLENLGTKIYDIDHIYPQSFVKDDSIINNKVLVLSEENGKKKNIYPVEGTIRSKMKNYWEYLKNAGLISKEKYKRLIRNTPFTDEEKWAFINRQLTETSQSTKAVATLLKEYMPETEIVYCKARLVSEFRQEFDLLKSRQYNDLHHAKDAYLNIVAGNVYNMKFTKNFNIHSNYSIKTETVFTHPVIYKGKTIWNGKESIAKIKSIASKNTAKFTKYSFMKKGGLFDQMPVFAETGLIPRKKGLSTEKYGGYNKPSIMFFIPVKYKVGEKTDIYIMSVELMHGNHFIEDKNFAKEYTKRRLSHLLKKKVDEISFPLSMKPWKINTVLSLDGFRVCISGSSNGGEVLAVQPIMQFSSDPFWEYYLKKLEVLVKKVEKNNNYIFDQEYDKVSEEKNLELYDLYCDKLSNSIYKKRINPPIKILRDGKEKFIELDIFDQAQALLNIHQSFGRNKGIDLSLLGVRGKAASTTLNCKTSNWGKNYKDVRVLNISPSGLWVKKSENILDLI
ncbi:MAG: type II CRISPR RNA-guided endonuclease Cas9 [Clostridia bacterium]|nr:type II CRISPR RNA-guided endonuclease Cas9 [Clostridia bacterium]